MPPFTKEQFAEAKRLFPYRKDEFSSRMHMVHYAFWQGMQLAQGKSDADQSVITIKMDQLFANSPSGHIDPRFDQMRRNAFKAGFDYITSQGK